MPESAAGAAKLDMIAKTFVTAAVVISAMTAACTAHADPPKFPDLNSYTPVDVQDYEIEILSPGMSSKQVNFITPDGITCTFMSWEAGCRGNNFPGIPPQPSYPDTKTFGINTIDTAVGLSKMKVTNPPDGTVQGHPIKTLPPFHSITVNGVICGVDDKQMTACKDAQGQGFILSPQWSGWLPHV